MPNNLKFVGVAVAALATSACGFVYDQQLDGPWRLVAVDTIGQLGLCQSIDSGGSCAGDGLPDLTVYSAGWNDRFIVIAGHPATDRFGSFDRSVSQFYYVVRSPDEKLQPGFSIQGPFDISSYDEVRQRVGLPAFSVDIGQNR